MGLGGLRWVRGLAFLSFFEFSPLFFRCFEFCVKVVQLFYVCFAFK